MRITAVEAFLMSYPFAEPLRLPFYGGERTILKRDAMLIRIQSDKGLTGYAPGPASESARAAIENRIAPHLAGQELSDPDTLRGNSSEQAWGAVEIALYDLIAKEQGVPLSEALGGAARDRIRLYG